MKSKNEIRQWMNRMVDTFIWLSFKYEYSEEDKIHYVAVFPLKKIEKSKDYCRSENEFYNYFSGKFPDETLLFGNEEYNFKCSDKAIAIRHTEPVRATG